MEKKTEEKQAELNIDVDSTKVGQTPSNNQQPGGNGERDSGQIKKPVRKPRKKKVRVELIKDNDADQEAGDTEEQSEEAVAPES